LTEEQIFNKQDTMALLTSNGKGCLPDYEVQGAKKVSFSPYSDNGG